MYVRIGLILTPLPIQLLGIIRIPVPYPEEVIIVLQAILQPLQMLPAHPEIAMELQNTDGSKGQAAIAPVHGVAGQQYLEQLLQPMIPEHFLLPHNSVGRLG